MYLRKMILIIFIFITTLICFSFACSIFFSISTGGIYDNSLVSENFFKLPLYMIGYGESPTVSRYIQLILCIAGIIMVNFLNAFLTVALFRFKSVRIKSKLIKNMDSSDFTALFTIANRGKQIYNVSFLLQVYEENKEGDIIELGQLEFTRKLINRKKSWKINHKIKTGDLFYTFFKSHFNGSGSIKLQGVLEYLDNDTGNQILTAKEFLADDFISIDLMSKNSDSKEKHSWLEEFKQFIGSKYKLIDLHRVKKIIENGDDRAMTLLVGNTKGKSELTAKLDFGSKDNNASPHFIMALIENIPGEDWSLFYKTNYSLEFDICSSASIHAVQLEIKSDYEGTLTKIIDTKINTFKKYKHHIIKLQEISNAPDLWKSVKEICFTCFSNDVNSKTGEFKIKDLKLASHSDN